MKFVMVIYSITIFLKTVPPGATCMLVSACRYLRIDVIVCLHQYGNQYSMYLFSFWYGLSNRACPPLGSKQGFE